VDLFGFIGFSLEILEIIMYFGGFLSLLSVLLLLRI